MCSARHVVAAWGVLAGTSPSPRCEASRAASDLVQVSRRPKSKHGRGLAAHESDGDEYEMEYADGGVASMAASVGRSCAVRCGGGSKAGVVLIDYLTKPFPVALVARIDNPRFTVDEHPTLSASRMNVVCMVLLWLNRIRISRQLSGRQIVVFVTEE
jgi:hypothetical protein